MDISDLISQADAARLRGVDRSTIHALVEKGRFTVTEIGGKKFLSRREVMSFVPDVGGRPSAKGKGKKKVGRKGDSSR